jgi:hypothetical protein
VEGRNVLFLILIWREGWELFALLHLNPPSSLFRTSCLLSFLLIYEVKLVDLLLHPSVLCYFTRSEEGFVLYFEDILTKIDDLHLLLYHQVFDLGVMRVTVWILSPFVS